MSGSSYFILGFSDATLTSKNIIPFTNLKDVSFTIKARTYGGPKNGEEKISVKAGNTLLGEVRPSNPTLSDYTITVSTLPSADAPITIVCETAAKNIGSGIQAFTLTGTELAQKTDPTAAFSATEATYTLGQSDFTAPTFTTNSDGTVTYESEKPEVATVDEQGTVTALKAGITTITATVAATATMNAASASYVLTVVDPYATAISFHRVTGDDALVPNATYLITGEKSGSLYAMGAMGSTNNNREAIAIEETSEGTLSNLTLNESGAPYTVCLRAVEGSEGKYFLQLSDGETYLNNARTATSNTNYLRETTTPAESAQFSFAFDDANTLTISSTAGSNIVSQLCFNASSTLFSMYGSGQSSPILYRQAGTFTADAALYNFLTFSPDYAYVMPTGATGFAVTSAQSDGTLALATAYKAGDKVPAHTALLIKAAEAGEFHPTILAEEVTATYSGTNYMEGTRSDDHFTASTQEGDVRYYKLSINADSQPGFYYGAADGAAFKMTKASTAYLAVPATQSAVKGFALLPDAPATGITAAPSTPASASAIYTLGGVRCHGALKELPAGIYLQGGKKILVK